MLFSFLHALVCSEEIIVYNETATQTQKNSFIPKLAANNTEWTSILNIPLSAHLYSSVNRIISTKNQTRNTSKPIVHFVNAF
jgi:hypothetical protein